MESRKEHKVNKPKTETEAAPERKPFTRRDWELGRQRLSDWMAEPERRAKKEGWSHDDFDDCG